MCLVLEQRGRVVGAALTTNDREDILCHKTFANFTNFGGLSDVDRRSSRSDRHRAPGVAAVVRTLKKTEMTTLAPVRANFGGIFAA